MLGNTDVQQLIGRTVYSTDGDKIGDIRQVYLNDQTEQPEFMTVNTGLLGTSENFVPLSEAQLSGDQVTIPFDKDKVKNAPNIAPDGHIDESQERELYAYYGLPGTGVNTGLDTGSAQRGVSETGTVGHDTSGPTTDQAMTRSEEQLHVGKERQEAGSARLKKWVETENHSETVPVEKERAVLEREPVTEGNADEALSGPAISEEEHEVVLTEERAVADKTVEPVERVRLGKETVTEEQTVSDDVRKEHIEVEGDTDVR
jgi:uncharacterized protein (TIGR02271 family)